MVLNQVNKADEPIIPTHSFEFPKSILVSSEHLQNPDERELSSSTSPGLFIFRTSCKRRKSSQ